MSDSLLDNKMPVKSIIMKMMIIKLRIKNTKANTNG